MANDLSNIMPKILARGLLVLRERAGLPRLVNGDYSAEAAEKGTTIDVPIPSALAAVAVTPANTPPATGDTTPTKVQVVMDQWFHVPFKMSDKDMTEVDKSEHFIPMEADEAVRALANNVNEYIFGKYAGVYGWVGDAGFAANSTPFASDVLAVTNARKILNQQLCPPGSRRMVLDFDAEANALALAQFSDAEKVGSAEVKIDGEIGRKFGMDFYADNAVPTHTAGTLSDGTNPQALVNNGGGYPAGSVGPFNIDETTLTGTLVTGDIISFSGHSSTYAVVTGGTAAANALTGIVLDRGLDSAIADGEQMTLKADHVVNLSFHRDAFAFANRPLTSNSVDMQLGNQILSLTDPQTGISLRLEVERQHKQVVWDYDLLYGAQLVRAALACRVAG